MILSSRLVLFDIVLIIIGGKRYFGVILHVNINEIASHNIPMNHTDFNINLMLTIKIYTSHECATAFEEQSKNMKSKKLDILKIANIKSSKSMIDAIDHLNDWPQYRSFLKPTNKDEYFQLPEDFDPEKKERIGHFNFKQSKIIQIAECMFDDLQDRLHLVHGPPGKSTMMSLLNKSMDLYLSFQEPVRVEQLLKLFFVSYPNYKSKISCFFVHHLTTLVMNSYGIL